MLPVLKVLEVQLNRLESVAAGTDNSDENLRRAITRMHTGQLRTKEHRPDLLAALESPARSCWGLRSTGRPRVDEGDGTSDCDRLSASESVGSGRSSHLDCAASPRSARPGTADSRGDNHRWHP